MPEARAATAMPVAPVLPLRPRATPSAPPTDAELLARCRRRDADAWRMLVDRYERLVYTVALRNGLAAEDAADVTQNTFVTLLDSLDRIRDEERLASWLMTVARRQSWRVRTLSRRTVDLDQVAEQSEDPLADWDTVTSLHDALATLGGHCRELLQALYLDAEEPSYAEIAARMGRSVGGIGPMRGRCLAKLRGILEDVR
ncbi:sigma-70 family RNA polymerase sigma factor [Nocardioides sp. zg-ZUI104]|uniref:RNA polymerase sigma factor n=1 Tax=Nocardioides faecalis TaxID=2803858 RepID=UPI001BCC3532|nr:sigma-70 family RNA polymerase sigma factor [Nocardioides faecalis]MBS4753704.1 sigma-70 family RNA polymerase sigma factor [Nocardioides faecalis]